MPKLLLLLRWLIRNVFSQINEKGVLNMNSCYVLIKYIPN